MWPFVSSGSASCQRSLPRDAENYQGQGLAHGRRISVEDDGKWRNQRAIRRNAMNAKSEVVNIV